jgi:isocitrate lyase
LPLEDGYTLLLTSRKWAPATFDKVTTIIQGGASSVTALTGSTEEAQF